MLRRRSARRSGPGVVGTVARTAMIAGTATAVSHGVSGAMAGKAQQKQQAQMASQAAMQTQADVQEMKQQLEAMQAQQVQAAVTSEVANKPESGTDLIAQLQQLADLKTAGLLTEAEFEAAKARVLGS